MPHRFDSKDYKEKRLVKGTRGFIQNNSALLRNVALEKGITRKVDVLVNPAHGLIAQDELPFAIQSAQESLDIAIKARDNLNAAILRMPAHDVVGRTRISDKVKFQERRIAAFQKQIRDAQHELSRIPARRELTHKVDAPIVCAQLVHEAKKKQRLNGTQGGWKVNESPLRKFWGVLYRFDQLHGTQLQNAMKVWMMQNPSIKDLKTRKRLPKMVEVACKMAAATGVVSTTATRGAFVSEGVI